MHYSRTRQFTTVDVDDTLIGARASRHTARAPRRLSLSPGARFRLVLACSTRAAREGRSPRNAAYVTRNIGFERTSRTIASDCGRWWISRCGTIACTQRPVHGASGRRAPSFGRGKGAHRGCRWMTPRPRRGLLFWLPYPQLHLPASSDAQICCCRLARGAAGSSLRCCMLSCGRTASNLSRRVAVQTQIAPVGTASSSRTN